MSDMSHLQIRISKYEGLLSLLYVQDMSRHKKGQQKAYTRLHNDPPDRKLSVEKLQPVALSDARKW